MKISEIDVKYLLESAIFLIVYCIAAKLGLKIDAVSGFATLVWLPTGISLTLLFILGFRFWPAVALGAFLVNLSTGAPPVIALGIALGNGLEALIGAYGLKKLGFRLSLDRVKDVLSLIFVAALFSTAISATVGTTSLFLGKIITKHAYLNTWSAWWIGDMISDLIIAPFIFVWINNPRIFFKPKRLIEEVASLVLLFIISLLVFVRILSFNKNAPITYLVFPPLIWISLRFTQRAATTAILFLFAVGVGSAVLGYGTFSEKPLSGSLFYLQSFMGITAITVMLLAARSTERRELEKKKDEFISIASHELRTPLTSMKILAYLVQKKFNKEGDKRSSSYIQKLNKQIDRLSNLVVELLDTSKIQEGKMVLDKQRFNIFGLIKDVVNTTYEPKKDDIVFKEKIKVNIVADRDRIEQVITNLLSNAIKYSPPKKKITITMARSDGFITIGVQNSGTGIPINEQEKIFDRFYQMEQHPNRAGLGLGLYIAKEIVERHNGTIWVESPLGHFGSRNSKMKGSAFYFRLPIKSGLSSLI